MPRAPGIVKRFPGEHVGKLVLWYPDKDKPGEFRTRWEAEGRLTKPAADLILALAMFGTRAAPELESRLEALVLELQNLPPRLPITETSSASDA